ncbi:MAG: Gfo/Idh/MocA family oxidoreductase [Spirochaetes bacterium]|nr:Gfo/Idh/MocA family oxidoreductase [Spirochaetota bacterium]
MDNLNKLKIGIIGAGDIANKGHITQYKSNENCEVVTICSQHKTSAIASAEKFGIPIVDDDYFTLLKRVDIDAVSICTPTYTHADIIENAVLQNKHILCEKPVAMNSHETKKIIKTMEGYKKKFMVMFNNRYRDENIWIKKRIEEGAVGDIKLIDIQWLRTKRLMNKQWLFKKDKSGGGVLRDLGVHLIDLVLWLIKDRKNFHVDGHSLRVNPYENSDVEDLVSAMIVIDDKIIINLKTGWTLKLNSPVKVNLNVYGDRGEISNSDYKGEQSDAYKKLIDDFIVTIMENREVDHKIYLDAMLLVDSIYESCETGKTVRGKF